MTRWGGHAFSDWRNPIVEFMDEMEQSLKDAKFLELRGEGETMVDFNARLTGWRSGTITVLVITPSKANVVDDALSRKTIHLSTLRIRELNLIMEFRDLSLACELTPSSIILDILTVANRLIDKVREAKRICISNDAKLKKMVLEEGYRNTLSIHLGSTKMYQDLRNMLWWPKMKREISFASSWSFGSKVVVALSVRECHYDENPRGRRRRARRKRCYDARNSVKLHQIINSGEPLDEETHDEGEELL
ncbi:hypothetical protein Fmac_026117 [Flemingia macrophylla]|uniref:Integrase zinc-binding domain-containing protein n=1 Tax=Flemingia macrophylla TaxID=520843 RepID=A0ABD1LEH7_9FABA